MALYSASSSSPCSPCQLVSSSVSRSRSLALTAVPSYILIRLTPTSATTLPPDSTPAAPSLTHLISSSAPLTDAPFGRWSSSSNSYTLPGSPSWLLMELISPLSLLHSAAQPLTATSSAPSSLSLSPLLHPLHLFHSLSTLPPSRFILLTAFLIHYTNRSLISTLRNWNGRASMAWYVPLLAAGFNLVNGNLMGTWLAGGLLGKEEGGWGVKQGVAPRVLFCAGMALWLTGFVLNIQCDQVLVRIKKDKERERERLGKLQGSARSEGRRLEQSPKERYAIPYGGPLGLYDLVSHPAYFAEWVEWTGSSSFFFSFSFLFLRSPSPSFAFTRLTPPPPPSLKPIKNRLPPLDPLPLSLPLPLPRPPIPLLPPPLLLLLFLLPPPWNPPRPSSNAAMVPPTPGIVPVE